MRSLLASLLLFTACVGPGQGALAKTSTAQTKATPSTAPAASTSDAEREHMVQTNETMRDADNAHREAAQESNAPPPPPLQGMPTPTPTPTQTPTP